MAKTGITTKWPKIFLFGDSLTQLAWTKDGCWASLVADLFQRRCDVVVRGFSGYNTRSCKYVLPKVLDESVAKDLAALTIFLGANDASDPELNPIQYVPLEEYKTNLEAMIDYCMSVGVSREKIILISPPALNAEAYANLCKQEGKAFSKDLALTTKYAAACVQAANERGVKVVKLFTEMMKDEDYAKYLSDGLHLSETGSQCLFDLLKPILEKLTGHVPQLNFPDFKTIDNDNPEPCFEDW